MNPVMLLLYGIIHTHKEPCQYSNGEENVEIYRGSGDLWNMGLLKGHGHMGGLRKSGLLVLA